MHEILVRSFDFSIRLTELVKYLRGEGREFPLLEHLMICGNSICVNLQMAKVSDKKERSYAINKALSYTIESGHLLKLMAKTGILNEQQSMPLREDCAHLEKMIEELK